MPYNNAPKELWEKLTGTRDEFTMENRAFNYVCLISFAVILFSSIINLIIGQMFMVGVMSILSFILGFLFYFSRFKKQFQAGIIIFASCSYLTLITNYYFNSGLKGPTMMLFFLTFHLLVTLSPTKFHKLWIFLHITVPLGIIGYDYTHERWIKDTYENREFYLIDITTSYVSVLLFVFILTNYLLKYYHREKKLATERLEAIEEQNILIKEQNIALQRINEEKNKMFSIVSHDLKSPIDSILGYLEVISQNLFNTEEKEQVEAELLSQTRYTSDLLQNLLFWSKAQMKGLTPKLVPLELQDLFNDARNYRIAQAAKKGIKLSYAVNKDLEVIGDKDMMRIILRNLVNNAIKFTHPGGEIAIKVSLKDKNAIISIQDNGMGIPEAKKDEIFTLKASSTYGTKDEKGVGLGLRLCKEFIDYQGGDIWFESTEGKGSTFFLSLPLAKF